MQSIVVRAISFLLMVVLAYLLKIVGVFKKEDGYALSRVMMNITLPCAIINSFSSASFSGKMLIFTFSVNKLFIFKKWNKRR